MQFSIEHTIMDLHVHSRRTSVLASVEQEERDVHYVSLQVNVFYIKAIQFKKWNVLVEVQIRYEWDTFRSFCSDLRNFEVTRRIEDPAKRKSYILH